MSTITKTIAESVANQLAKKKKEALNKKQAKLRAVFQEIYLKTVPKEVLDMFEKYPNWINSQYHFNLSGNGLNYERFQTEKSVPYTSTAFIPTPEDAKILVNLKNEIQVSKNQLEDLILELKNTLISLRTYKRVEENFPEAFVLLPKKENTALALNLSDLRNKIK